MFPAAEALLSTNAVSILGMDGQKMSKSRGNVIELGMSADETARLIKRAVTDSDRHITYDPVGRPAVSNLVTLAALCQDRDPFEVAEELGDAGGGGLKRLVTEALNDRLAPHRARRAELVAEPGYVRQVLLDGNARADAVAEATLDDVRTAMQMVY